jgi:hypothetical protein
MEALNYLSRLIAWLIKADAENWRAIMNGDKWAMYDRFRVMLLITIVGVILVVVLAQRHETIMPTPELNTRLATISQVCAQMRLWANGSV